MPALGGRLEPGWRKVGVVKVHVTGRLRLEGSNRVAEATDFPGRQGRVVFASLLVAAHAVDRAVLADRIWGEDLPPTWERHLSSVMSKLRTLLESADPHNPPLIRALGEAYELELREGTEVDLHVAEEAVQVMERCLQTNEPVPSNTVETALDILARPFLPGESSAWVEALRLDLRALYVRALESAAEIRARAGDKADAVELARSVIEL